MKSLNWKIVGVLFVFCWYFFGGIAHFTETEFFIGILWESFPLKREVVLISGAIEIAMALAIWVPSWRPVMGYIIFAFTLAVSPVNIYHWLHPEMMPDTDPRFFAVRLIVQVLFLALIWWCTRPDTPAPKNP